MNWYIGQEIVCIQTHSSNVVRKGKVYTIKGIMASPCSCKDISLDVGVASEGLTGCNECNVTYSIEGQPWWLSELLFAPLEYNQDAINELLENTLVESV